MALVLAPEAPFAEWLSELDDLIRRSPGFFVGRAVILDVTRARLDKADLAALIADLHGRDIRITGVEGADPSWLGLGMPPPISGGRATSVVEVRDGAPPEAPAEPAAPKEAACLLIDDPVRSGQSIIFPDGDVTVVGSVASGAEVIAGGSIHIYGSLRGRAIAGSMGNAKARIFCRKFEAELVAIDGLYKTADEMAKDLRGRPVQARLDGDAIVTVALD
jgi:septum site-determining protein MinC